MLAKTWMDGKRALVQALNDVNLSLAEYHWVRGRAYAAIGLPVLDLDVSKLVKNIEGTVRDEDVARIDGSIGPSGPEENRQLVERHRKQLEDNAALASFGL